MQFKLYNTSLPYEDIINLMGSINTSHIRVIQKEKLPEDEGVKYLLHYDDYLRLGDTRISPLPVRFQLYVLNIKGNALIVLELMRGINNEETLKKKLGSSLKLEEFKFNNDLMKNIYKEFSRKFLGAYIKTHRGVYMEVETESEFKTIVQEGNIEIHSVTFIPKIEYEGIPLVAIRREGVIIVDMDYETAIKFIYTMLDKILTP